MKLLRIVKFFFLFLLGFVFLSCVPDVNNSDYQIVFSLEKYKAAKEKWENLNCSDYSFTYMICADYGKSPLVQVTISDGKTSYQIMEGVYESDSQEEDKKILEDSEKFFSVESLFNHIWASYEEALEIADNPPEGLLSRNIKVSYDDESGIPLSIEIGGTWSELACGDWWSLNVEDFELLN